MRTKLGSGCIVFYWTGGIEPPTVSCKQKFTYSTVYTVLYCTVLYKRNYLECTIED